MPESASAGVGGASLEKSKAGGAGGPLLSVAVLNVPCAVAPNAPMKRAIAPANSNFDDLIMPAVIFCFVISIMLLNSEGASLFWVH
jgi:hypothetical protein